MNQDHFDVLLLLARPAAGKSEIIHYLENVPEAERLRRFYVGALQEIDDFPMLWEWFEEDDILTSLGRPRLHTDADGLFVNDSLWDVLIHKINLEYQKRQRDAAGKDAGFTTLIEFSRGSQHGGFTRAFAHLSPQIASQAAILYLNVSYEESLRKNRRRFNPERPDSILEHGLPDKKMEFLYHESDWPQLTAADPERILIQGVQVPYVIFENEDDVTTPQGEALGKRLEETLSRLWRMYRYRS
jgi:hypothetical protein